MLFRRKPADTEAKDSFALNPFASRLPADSVLEGRLDVAEDLVIAGRLVGDVQVGGELTVLAGGYVEGAVEAKVVRIAGHVKGPVIGSERVEVAPGGIVTGDIASAHVVLADGAVLHGQVDVV